MRTKEFSMEEIEQNEKKFIKLREIKNKEMLKDQVKLAFYERVIKENDSFILERGIVPITEHRSFNPVGTRTVHIDNSHEIGLEDIEDEYYEEPIYEYHWDENEDDVIYPYTRRKMTDEEQERIINEMIVKEPFIFTQNTNVINTYIGKTVSLPLFNKVLSDISKENGSEINKKCFFTYDDLETVSDYISKNAKKYGIDMEFNEENVENNEISHTTNNQKVYEKRFECSKK